MLGGGEASGRPDREVRERMRPRPRPSSSSAPASSSWPRASATASSRSSTTATRAWRCAPRRRARASSSPVPVGDELYVDGDEASPVPIRVARQLGAEIVIAVDVSAYLTETPAGVPHEWVEKDARRARQIAAEAPEADVMLHPDIGYYAGHNEEYRTARDRRGGALHAREDAGDPRGAESGRSAARRRRGSRRAKPRGSRRARTSRRSTQRIALASRHLVHVARGAVRVAVDHEVAARIGEGALHRARGDVHDVHLLGLLRALAFHAHAPAPWRCARRSGARARPAATRDRAPARGTPGTPCRRCRACRRAEQRSRPVEVDLGGIGDECRRRCRARTAPPARKSRLPCMKRNGHALGGGAAAARRCGAGKGKGEPVVAHPVLEEVAQDVERLGVRRHVGEETLELRDDRRARGGRGAGPR